ncbi:IS3 family transposase [Arthrobacter sp. JCM 19049]|uniref:IS3 family transposase n=1 Tax=Arthrobacter sp. JCM 19049 TaxID=1460643 RepID=UPI000A792C3F
MSSYYAFKKRPPSARSVRDEQLMPKLLAIYEENYSCYGVRKMWHAMNHEHAEAFGPIVRCTVQRLMKSSGLTGCGASGRSPRPALRIRKHAPWIWWIVSSRLQRPTGSGWLI